MFLYYKQMGQARGICLSRGGTYIKKQKGQKGKCVYAAPDQDAHARAVSLKPTRGGRGGPQSEAFKSAKRKVKRGIYNLVLNRPDTRFALAVGQVIDQNKKSKHRAQEARELVIEAARRRGRAPLMIDKYIQPTPNIKVTPLEYDKFIDCEKYPNEPACKEEPSFKGVAQDPPLMIAQQRVLGRRLSR